MSLRNQTYSLDDSTPRSIAASRSAEKAMNNFRIILAAGNIPAYFYDYVSVRLLDNEEYTMALERDKTEKIKWAASILIL